MPSRTKRFRIGFTGTHRAEVTVALLIRILVLLAVLSAGAAQAAQAKQQRGEAITIEQGRFLAAVASCNDCHDDVQIGSAADIEVEALNGVYGASKAYLLAFSLSLQHELGARGIRVQAVLPGRTATDGWEVTGLPWQKLPPSMVIPVEDMVDAALAGLDQGELVTIPGLHNGDEWTRFEAARRAISQRFGNSVPAPRYRNQARRSA